MKKEPTMEFGYLDYQGKRHGGGCIASVIAIVFLLFSMCAQAQTDTAALRKRIESEMIAKLNAELAERPVWLIVFDKRKQRTLWRIAGYMKNGLPLDSRKQVLPEWIYVWSVIARDEQQNSLGRGGK